MYEVEYSSSARKLLKRLPKEKQKHILSVLERSRINPEKRFERLVGQKAYKLRAGDFRIIADIYYDKLCILVIQIGIGVCVNDHSITTKAVI